jgi:hypothetical protein
VGLVRVDDVDNRGRNLLPQMVDGLENSPTGAILLVVK